MVYRAWRDVSAVLSSARNRCDAYVHVHRDS